MDSPELRDALEDVGLSQYQAEAYNRLLRLGTASATELADSCAVPAARIYDVLRDLETKGYIETYEQESLKARACDPATVLEDLRGRASMLEDAADEIEDRWDQPEVEQHKLSVVTRFGTVMQRAASLVRSVPEPIPTGGCRRQMMVRERPPSNSLTRPETRGILICPGETFRDVSGLETPRRYT